MRIHARNRPRVPEHAGVLRVCVGTRNIPKFQRSRRVENALHYHRQKLLPRLPHVQRSEHFRHVHAHISNQREAERQHYHVKVRFVRAA